MSCRGAPDTDSGENKEIVGHDGLAWGLSRRKVEANSFSPDESCLNYCLGLVAHGK